MKDLKTAPDFEPLAIAFKRVANIVKKAAEKSLDQFSPRINASLFQDPSETALYDAYQTVKKRVSRHLSQGDFAQALRNMASLRDPVDAFFVAVLVMADDPDIRKNRLTLLERIGSLFDAIADFTKISGIDGRGKGTKAQRAKAQSNLCIRRCAACMLFILLCASVPLCICPF